MRKNKTKTNTKYFEDIEPKIKKYPLKNSKYKSRYLTFIKKTEKWRKKLVL